ncbi:TraB/GumN family protein, partial [Variovorax sp. KBS0712]
GGRSAFAAVGALHMVGAQGLPTLMAARGFTVTPVLTEAQAQQALDAVGQPGVAVVEQALHEALLGRRVQALAPLGVARQPGRVAARPDIGQRLELAAQPARFELVEHGVDLLGLLGLGAAGQPAQLVGRVLERDDRLVAVAGRDGQRLVDAELRIQAVGARRQRGQRRHLQDGRQPGGRARRHAGLGVLALEPAGAFAAEHARHRGRVGRLAQGAHRGVVARVELQRERVALRQRLLHSGPGTHPFAAPQVQGAVEPRGAAVALDAPQQAAVDAVAQADAGLLETRDGRGRAGGGVGRDRDETTTDGREGLAGQTCKKALGRRPVGAARQQAQRCDEGSEYPQGELHD